MKLQIRCAHCGCLFHPNPRVKNQCYCGKRDCRRARKRLWQRAKLASDPDYKQNQRDSQRLWSDRHPQYWKDYRHNHPDYAEKNRRLQNARDSRRSGLAKMDALRSLSLVKQGTYYLVPESANLAKMDASTQKVRLIPIG